jgi:hypothetical protein
VTVVDVVVLVDVAEGAGRVMSAWEVDVVGGVAGVGVVVGIVAGGRVSAIMGTEGVEGGGGGGSKRVVEGASTIR